MNFNDKDDKDNAILSDKDEKGNDDDKYIDKSKIDQELNVTEPTGKTMMW